LLGSLVFALVPVCSNLGGAFLIVEQNPIRRLMDSNFCDKKWRKILVVNQKKPTFKSAIVQGMENNQKID